MNLTNGTSFLVPAPADLRNSVQVYLAATMDFTNGASFLVPAPADLRNSVQF